MISSRIYEFEDVNLSDIILRPTAEKNIRKKNMSCMTETIMYRDISVTTKAPKTHIEIQTDDSDFKSVKETGPIDEDDLIKFLNQAVPRVLDAINENENSRTLENYLNIQSITQNDAKSLYTLYNKDNILNEKQNQLEITDIAWNSSGMIIAASARYGKFEHTGMCYDHSFLCIWNLNKRDFNPENPSLTLETNGCIMCLEFHPTMPSILASGTFNGELQLWNVSKGEENLLFSSKIDDYFHRESISQIIWLDQRLPGTIITTYNIMTLSTDGKLLIWNLDHQLKYPTKGYSLIRKKDGLLSYVGGLSISQSSEEKACFILGTEAGSVFKMLVNNINHDRKQKILFEQKTGNSQVRWKEETFPIMFNLFSKNLPEIKSYVEEYCDKRGITEIKCETIFQSKPDIRKMYTNPISIAYEQHNGPVYSVAFSPFHRNLFLTCSLDGSIKLFELNQNKPLLTFELGNTYLFKVGWSPVRPCVFAAASSNGEILIFDLVQSTNTPIHILRNEEAKGISNALTLKFNKVQKDLLACVYSGCIIKIYQLGEGLCSSNTNDIMLINSFTGDSKQQKKAES